MEHLMKFNSVNKMLGELKLLTRSDNTTKTYLKGVNLFAKMMKIDDLDGFVEKLRVNSLDPDQTYKDFVIGLANQNMAPKTVGAWGASVKKFFLSNGIELKGKVAMRMYNVHEDTLPSKADLKNILSNSSSRAKIIILMLASSGLRIGELRNLKLSDVDLNSTPATVRVKGITAKERKSRLTFISEESKKSLQSYIDHRKSSGHQLDPDAHLFATHDGSQMSYQNLQFILNNVFRKVSKKVGKRYELHAHSLRKYFKTQMIAAGVPGPIVDRLTGHARYLSQEYELYTEEQLKEWYLKGVKNLELFG